MQEAIKRAIEGGWDSARAIELEGVITSAIFLDPLFWQALGKAEGWTNSRRCPVCEQPKLVKKKGRAIASDIAAGWEYFWHRFIDHLAEGRDIDSFFNELLCKK